MTKAEALERFRLLCAGLRVARQELEAAEEAAIVLRHEEQRSVGYEQDR